MSLEYISVDNECPKINLWQQYKKLDALVYFFNLLKTYWQEQYFDYLYNTCIPNLSVYNAESSYLYFLSLNMFNIPTPIKIEDGAKYDIGIDYDSGAQYDTIVGTTPVTYMQLRKTLLFTLNWSKPNWDIPTFYYLISEFTGLGWDEIEIEQDSTLLNKLTITIPTSINSLLFELMVNYYKEILGLPFGIDFVIIVTT